MVEWNDGYLVGIDLIDKQHKYFFEIGSNAYKLLNDNSDVDKREEINIIIQDLLQYAKYHFKAEENYMIKSQYKDYIMHKAEHDDFVKKIAAIDLDQIQKEPEKVAQDILALIFNWLPSHIVLKDKLINAPVSN
ncbi:MAG: hemerythrin family protein [Syntrophomonas sp.]